MATSILVGSSELDAHEVYVVKIKADGSLDQEFGQQGVLALGCEAAISKNQDRHIQAI
ncbi:MAG: hypothetical protein IPN76_29420 [Saprospiraceae bacterium]|nr:hypothetical protein [Saprospiraceae bacterium]